MLAAVHLDQHRGVRDVLVLLLDLHDGHLAVQDDVEVAALVALLEDEAALLVGLQRDLAGHLVEHLPAAHLERAEELARLQEVHDRLQLLRGALLAQHAQRDDNRVLRHLGRESYVGVEADLCAVLDVLGEIRLRDQRLAEKRVLYRLHEAATVAVQNGTICAECDICRFYLNGVIYVGECGLNVSFCFVQTRTIEQSRSKLRINLQTHRVIFNGFVDLIQPLIRKSALEVWWKKLH